MKKALEKINELVKLQIIKKYAIGGAMGQFYYIEAGTTYDLDIMVELWMENNPLDPLRNIYDWARNENLEQKDEHIIIDGLPVQFLPAYNELIKDAVDSAVNVELFSTNVKVMKAEHLMAIMLQTYRPIDKTRLARFFSEAEYDVQLFTDILKKYELTERLKEYKEKY